MHNCRIPVYSGGAIRNSVNAAQERVAAGKRQRGTESTVFSQTVTAYMDVLRFEALARLAANQVEVLEVTFQSTSDRSRLAM